MNKKWYFIVLSLIAITIFTGCPTWYSDYDVHYTYNQNASSRNIFIQYYMKPDPFYQYPQDIYYTYGNALAQNSGAEGLYGVVGPGADSVVEKILIIDTDSHKLLKKIDSDTFYAMLTKKISVEEEKHEKITYYIYYFTITDEFLKDQECQ